MRVLTLFVLIVTTAFGQSSFEAELNGPLWKEKPGALTLTADGIEFLPKGKEEAQRWAFADIQLFDLVTRTEVRVLTYEDSKWKLGRDRELRFRLLSGEISEELFATVQAKLTRPANDRVLDQEAEATRRIAVKHLHPIGGCDGELLFYAGRIVYDSRQHRHNRDWQVGSGVEGVWSADRYELELNVREPKAGKPGEIATWRYQLKQPLDPKLYDSLKRELYALEAR